MKKTLLLLTVLFTVLTFVGAGYVLSTGGQASAGYAAVPMVLTAALMSVYRQQKK